MGHATQHTPQSLAASWDKAFVVLPRPLDGAFEGVLQDVPKMLAPKSIPLVVFLHGSSGFNPAIRELARFFAGLGVGFLAPDSFQLPDRMTYTSPIARDEYEKVHAMRLAELNNAVDHLPSLPWFSGQFIIAGTSEGGVSAARYHTRENYREQGRILFSWSCEDNYHVVAHRTDIPNDMPVLNIMSATDKFFSPANSYLDNPHALGYAGKALAKNSQASIVLIPGAPHTLLNLPQAHDAERAFLHRYLHV